MFKTKIRYLSLFSGIEAATVAWEPLGFEPVAFAENAKAPAQLLKENYPSVPNLGDVTRITESDIKALGTIDLVIFGSPCQDLSIAGKRAGMAGERSGLFYDAIRIIQWAREHNRLRFALWENVKGALSSQQGRDFASVVGELAGCSNFSVPENGWGKEGAALGDVGLVEWSVLDAQWFGLAQRRERVFALADFGNWSSRPPLLLERDSLRGDSAPSRQGEQAAPNQFSYCIGQPTQPYRLNSYVFTGGSSNSMRSKNGVACKVAEVSPTLDTTMPCPAKNQGGVGVVQDSYLRRLTPLECERLMGFPDHHTAALSNTKRYETLGNSMAIPVLRWIGGRIAQVFA